MVGADVGCCRRVARGAYVGGRGLRHGRNYAAASRLSAGAGVCLSVRACVRLCACVAEVHAVGTHSYELASDMIENLQLLLAIARLVAQVYR